MNQLFNHSLLVGGLLLVSVATSGCNIFERYERKPAPAVIAVPAKTVCNAKCDVQRNCYGPTGSAEAVGGLGHLHDCFTCPHREEDWHHYASQLIDQKRDCASRRVRELVDLDLQETLTFRSVL